MRSWSASEVRRLEERVRDLERLLGRKTMEVEILKRRSTWHGQKNRSCCRTRRCREIPGEGGRHDAGRGAVEHNSNVVMASDHAADRRSEPVMPSWRRRSVVLSTRDRPTGTGGSPRY